MKKIKFIGGVLDGESLELADDSFYRLGDMRVFRIMKGADYLTKAIYRYTGCGNSSEHRFQFIEELFTDAAPVIKWEIEG